MLRVDCTTVAYRTRSENPLRVSSPPTQRSDLWGRCGVRVHFALGHVLRTPPQLDMYFENQTPINVSHSIRLFGGVVNAIACYYVSGSSLRACVRITQESSFFAATRNQLRKRIMNVRTPPLFAQYLLASRVIFLNFRYGLNRLIVSRFRALPLKLYFELFLGILCPV